MRRRKVKKRRKREKAGRLAGRQRARCHTIGSDAGEKGCFAERHRAYGEPCTLIGRRAYGYTRDELVVRRLRLQTDTRGVRSRRGIAKKGVGSSRMGCRARDGRWRRGWRTRDEPGGRKKEREKSREEQRKRVTSVEREREREREK